MDGNPYVLGVALHDLQNPEQVKVSNIPILFPSKADCNVTETSYVHVPNVVFCCGALRKDNGEIYQTIENINSLKKLMLLLLS